MGRYGIKEVFATLQGEGARAGTKAVFVRFTGCNLWDGLPLHRESGKGACAKWCDTDFFKGKVLSSLELAHLASVEWGVPVQGERWVVLTGGEPTLQIDHDLMAILHDEGWSVAVETNGTEENRAACEANHICVAPKLTADGKLPELVIERAHEVKVVLPGAHVDSGLEGWSNDMLAQLEMIAHRKWPGARLFVQPQDPLVSTMVAETHLVRGSTGVFPNQEASLRIQYERSLKQCIAHVMRNPRWALSIQTHKLVGLP